MLSQSKESTTVDHSSSSTKQSLRKSCSELETQSIWMRIIRSLNLTKSAEGGCVDKETSEQSGMKN